ncbi:hypothetical protein ABW20_dc0101073 [Dactylellina cionopaga]|nr:hypothetical protein ABW20_dc0101073 [Dactylellina cionopaga]
MDAIAPRTDFIVDRISQNYFSGLSKLKMEYYLLHNGYAHQLMNALVEHPPGNLKELDITMVMAPDGFGFTEDGQDQEVSQRDIIYPSGLTTIELHSNIDLGTEILRIDFFEACLQSTETLTTVKICLNKWGTKFGVGLRCPNVKTLSVSQEAGGEHIAGYLAFMFPNVENLVLDQCFGRERRVRENFTDAMHSRYLQWNKFAAVKRVTIFYFGSDHTTEGYYNPQTVSVDQDSDIVVKDCMWLAAMWLADGHMPNLESFKFQQYRHVFNHSNPFEFQLRRKESGEYLGLRDISVGASGTPLLQS